MCELTPIDGKAFLVYLRAKAEAEGVWEEPGESFEFTLAVDKEFEELWTERDRKKKEAEQAKEPELAELG